MFEFLRRKVAGKKSLNKKFIFLFLLASLLPTCIVGVISYNIATMLVLHQKVNEIYTKLEKVQTDCSKKVNEKETQAIKFYISDDVQSLLIHCENDSETYYQVMKLLFSNEYTDINDITFLCDKNGVIYTNSMIQEEDANVMLQQGKGVLDADETCGWFASESVNGQFIIPFIRKIDDLHDPHNKDIGYFVTGIQEPLLHGVYNSYFGSETGTLFLINADQQVLSGTQQEYIGHNLQEFLVSDKRKNNSYYEAKIGRESYYIVPFSDSTMNWEYLYLLKKSVMMDYMKNIRMVPIIGMIISILVSVFITVAATASVTRPIQDIISTIKEINDGDYSVRFHTVGSLEIMELRNFLNDMMDRLQKSMNQIYQVQKQRRDAELKALVLQINPHFLYNTLSSITWLCQADQKESVIEMISSLATLFRISISRGNEIITMKEELDHAESYLHIQKIRFSNKFTYQINIDEGLLGCYTLKVILQPLLENSINHALAGMEEQGEIQINISAEGEDLILCVKDNGNGMTKEQVQQLNAHLCNRLEERNFGIGTTNVNDRVKLLFGEQYGLIFEKEDRWVVAKVRIPMLNDRKEVEKYQNGEERYV